MSKNFIEHEHPRVKLKTFHNIVSVGLGVNTTLDHFSLVDKISEIVPKDEFLLIYVGFREPHIILGDSKTFEVYEFNWPSRHKLRKIFAFKQLDMLIQTKTEEQGLLIKTVMNGWNK